MGEKTINFDNKKIIKCKFYKIKRLFKIDDINIDKILASKKEPFGKKDSFNGIAFKYFIAYEDHDYVSPLCIKLPQMIGYVKYFDNNKTMSFRKIYRNMKKSKT